MAFVLLVNRGLLGLKLHETGGVEGDELLRVAESWRLKVLGLFWNGKIIIRDTLRKQTKDSKRQFSWEN